MKRLAKKIIVGILGWQVRRLRRKNSFKIIAVAGSIGKTSTKFAISEVLSQQFRVRFQAGNYNDIVSVPLVFFDLFLPSLLNPFAWVVTFVKIEKQLHEIYPFDYVVVELGTDGPGQLKNFGKYVHADLGVLTAITPEHMEFFKSLEDVADEELVLAQMSDSILLNKDLSATSYINKITIPLKTYSLNKGANYRISDIKVNDSLYEFDIFLDEKLILHTKNEAISESQFYSLCAATAVGDIFGISPELIDKGLHDIKPVAGRMKHLKGVNNSLIIDDTYNASPVAVKGALDSIYKMTSPQKIAILGNMNELGVYSKAAHLEIGNYCNPKQLNLVVTIGPDANKYLAEAAKQKKCEVVSFSSPYEAGKYLKPLIKSGAIILAKGSQNGVFAEEAVKVLLADPTDASNLVRQSSFWLRKKAKQFGLKR